MNLISHDAGPGQPWSSKALTTSIKVLSWVGLRLYLDISKLSSVFFLQLMEEGVFPAWNLSWCMVDSARQISCM